MLVTKNTAINHNDHFLYIKFTSGLHFSTYFQKLTKLMIVLFLIFIVNTQFYSQSNELDKLLNLDLEELTDLKVISATKWLNKISQVPATVEVITSEKIEENAYTTLEEVLSDLPGFQFRNILGFNSYVFQRGIPNQNNYTLLLVDGNEINELNSGGFYGGGQFNLQNVKRIEVVYGPASSLYGTNAISGVINIITKKPSDEEGLRISGLLGSFNTYRSNVSYDYFDDEKEIGFRIAGMIYNTEKADLGGAEGDYNWSTDMENFETDYSLNIKSTYRNIDLGVLYQNKRASRTTNYKSIGTNYLDKNSLWNIGFLNAYIKHQFNISSVLNIQSKVVYRSSTVYDNTVAYVTDTSQVGYYRPSYSLRGETIAFYKPIEILKVIGGALFESEWLSDDFSITRSSSSTEKPNAPAQPNSSRNDLLSLFLQTELSITNSINLFTGARYDHSSFYGDVVIPRLGIVYNNSGLSLKALYSEAFRAPKPWDYTSGLGNLNLNPEKMRSLEIALGYYFSNNTLLRLSFYNNKLHDIITQENVGNNYRWINGEVVKVQGLEVSSKIRYKVLDIYFNYTYNFPIDNENNFIPEISKHTANLDIGVEVTEDLKLSTRCNYLGKRNNTKKITSIDSYIIEDAIVFNAALQYTGVNKFIFTFSAKNILDKEYYHSSNRPPDRYRQPQRTLLFAVDYTF